MLDGIAGAAAACCGACGGSAHIDHAQAPELVSLGTRATSFAVQNEPHQLRRVIGAMPVCCTLGQASSSASQ